MLERDYQASLIRKLKSVFPGCIVLKNDSAYKQGIPDLLILWNEHWAALEVKVSAKARVQPNQRYYVEQMHEMSFAAFIYPENEEDVFHDLQQAFAYRRRSRVSKS